ncbi:uncharacterized protein LAESUDRAFT_720897 [Laetiporus sulphureus 93-53]|uniref:Uncharacterized protein n=1 Tax=Laetiporus sulphureus 93-53 TaxID=1314785 RepID=A0A165HEN8_9APHY|nr:uncharacterized protein LAESUDRAFT_720897 [Laetiporus sulphureus 93-53]KZT11638.1 hypothetical protein LAESUDRAFT_720897 [Laetiporus sulphureus 93-53]
MHRLRKKSDTKRSQAAAPVRAQPPEPMPTLSLADDFRTSLILPDLTRRFSLLRSSSGTPIALDDLKNKFAEQRARGSRNQVTEEEEDMILEALGRLHARAAGARMQGEPSALEHEGAETENHDPGPDPSDSLVMAQSSARSSTAAGSLLYSTSISSSSSGKASNASRRMSNNLFGSGKFRDEAILRSANQVRRGGTNRAGFSVMPSDLPSDLSSMSPTPSSNVGPDSSLFSDSHSVRSGTPEGSTYSPANSVPSSPRINRPTQSSLAASNYDHTAALSARLSQTLTPNTLKRASLALDEVIRELEEEGDDEILMERSPVNHTSTGVFNTYLSTNVERNSPLASPADYEAVTALSSDDQVVHADHDSERSPSNPRSATTSPAPRLPGYIPGMPRPMTPHDMVMDSEDWTPSTTPRATSPRLPGTSPSPIISQRLASTVHRSNSVTSTSRQSSTRGSIPGLPSTPPLFFNRSTNGKFTPDDRQRSGSSSSSNEMAELPTQARRRPTSPLSSSSPYQSLAGPSSRPGTPSNVTWNTSTSSESSRAASKNAVVSVHSRNGSSLSIADAIHDVPDRSASVASSVRSPILPESPIIDRGIGASNLLSPSEVGYRSPSAMSAADLGSPLQLSTRSIRSPTPTHSRHKSSASASVYERTADTTNGDSYGGSRRSSKQKHHSSFSWSSTHALLLSPIANSSRSSIESGGSSYHSWDEGHKKDRVHALLSSLDPEYTDWHDLSNMDKSDKSDSSTPGTSPYEGLDIEEVVWRQSGLKKTDFVAIQDKLVSAAFTKAATPDGRNRASSLRKRRPSTSQSNYSYNGTDNRVTSPTPQPQSPSSVGPVTNTRAAETQAKATALLGSLVDSIESRSIMLPPVTSSQNDGLVDHVSMETQLSSPGRRQRALADALFGTTDDANTAVPTVPPPPSADPEGPVARKTEPETEEPDGAVVQSLQTQPPTPQLFDTKPLRLASATALHTHNQVDAAQLALEVRQRAEAATAALRKSPSIPKITDAAGTQHRKRIDPRQISSPTFLSSSKSVDGIPVRSATLALGASGTGSNSKIGSRFKRLRGTLRPKVPFPSQEELAPDSSSFRPVPPAPAITQSSPNLLSRVDPAMATVPVPVPVPVSTSLSPPASATPGLKGFMARFRKQRAADAYPSPQRQRALQPSSASVSIYQGNGSVHGRPSWSAPATKTGFTAESTPACTSLGSSPQSSPYMGPESELKRFSQSHSQPLIDEAALKQLFDAATNLGLDQAALNDLLARSPSTSSKLMRGPSVNESPKNRYRGAQRSDSPEPAAVPPSGGRPSVDNVSRRPSLDATTSTTKKSLEATIRTPRINVSDNVQNTIVRRTIIMPSDTMPPSLDFNMLLRKQSASKRRRSAGASSIQSARSIHDRVPTPPPHKAASGGRFSADGSPPVPQLPPSFSQADHTGSPMQVEQSNSVTDSVYEMYTSDNRALTPSNLEPHGRATPSYPQNQAASENGPAIEVIEMANGEMIWSIVNGLRDDDGESVFDDRASFVSEYSRRDSNNEGLKLFFKGHEKKSSKGSNVSFSPRKKQSLKSTSAVRPETKVFFSSSAHIGQLIENLSRGVDSGSFNVAPEQPQASVGHSASSSIGSDAEMRWTVEERLEHMLGAMGSAA